VFEETQSSCNCTLMYIDDCDLSLLAAQRKFFFLPRVITADRVCLAINEQTDEQTQTYLPASDSRLVPDKIEDVEVCLVSDAVIVKRESPIVSWN